MAQVAEEHSHSNEHGHEGHECGPDCTGHAHDQHDHSHEHSHDEKVHGHSHGHKHDDAVTSVSITMDGVMDLEKVNYWLGALIELRSEDLYRFKGVLSIADFDRRFVFQVGTPQRAAPLGRAEAVGLLLDKAKPPPTEPPPGPAPQGVHMLFEGMPDRPWQQGERRFSKMVFIGKDLDEEVIRQGFAECMVPQA